MKGSLISKLRVASKTYYSKIKVHILKRKLKVREAFVTKNGYSLIFTKPMGREGD